MNKMEDTYNFDNLDDIERFTLKYIEAQDALFDEEKHITFYQEALAEIRAGNKTNHWIWYIFPQHIDLGRSYWSKRFGLPSLRAAIVYLQNETLRERLLEITEALLQLETTDLMQVMWEIDCFKVRSCASIFYFAACREFGDDSPEANIFKTVLARYFHRIGYCELTLKVLQDSHEIEDVPEEDWEVFLNHS